MPPARPADLDHVRRVLVYGVTGSGKSTAARQIADRLGLPCIMVDELTWKPGWVPVPGDEQRRRLAGIAATGNWVLDTAYSSWLDAVMPRVQLVVGLDYPRWFSFQRLVRRTVARMIDRRPICNGNVETLRSALGRDSILRWHFRSFARKRDRMRGWSAEADGPPVLLFRRARDLDRWIAVLGQQPHPPLPAAPVEP